MENWGLCTFQVTALLYDEATSTLDNKERVSYVIAHGISPSHLGNSFSNLVQSLPISGLAISSPWIGGTIYGSRRALPLGLVGLQPIISIQVS